MEGDTEFWTSHVEACRREGMAASVYERQHGLTLVSLYYWRRKLTRTTVTGADGAANQFVALRVVDMEVGAATGTCTLTKRWCRCSRKRARRRPRTAICGCRRAARQGGRWCSTTMRAVVGRYQCACCMITVVT